MHPIDKTFVLAGKAVFTVSNPAGIRYTFRVKHKKAEGSYPEAWFAQLLTGPDNTKDYTYLGKVLPGGELKLTAKSPYPATALPVKVLAFALRVAWGVQVLPAGYAIHHEGQCARCGHPLTVPESIDAGFGPECIKLICRPAA